MSTQVLNRRDWRALIRVAVVLAANDGRHHRAGVADLLVTLHGAGLELPLLR